MTELFASPAFWGSLATLTFLEIVLGIDNLLFVSIATGKLKGEQSQTRAPGFEEREQNRALENPY